MGARLKEYTRVYQGETILFRYLEFAELGDILHKIRRLYPNERLRIEYFLKDEVGEVYILALYYVHSGRIIGWVFPYGSFRSNNSLSLLEHPENELK